MTDYKERDAGFYIRPRRTDPARRRPHHTSPACRRPRRTASARHRACSIVRFRRALCTWARGYYPSNCIEQLPCPMDSAAATSSPYLQHQSTAGSIGGSVHGGVISAASTASLHRAPQHDSMVVVAPSPYMYEENRSPQLSPSMIQDLTKIV
ncbi:hypothetical protein SORBI_3008G091671 [Sorghum bicolor]|uniref:Uncharacterized protein n=1 Tax=Sorghum bicolor TaxID=4558 RepID=A0A1Z5R5M1_SORBI|nr:hypothetical protein SORBI_3008G091671 [Sorghum bicolor]